MKVLFISSGNAKEGISSIIKNQGESLICREIQVDFFTIRGKGLWSYIRHIFILQKFLKSNTFDIIHAHYSLSAYVATFAGARPLIVSLMGSDVKSNKRNRYIIKFFNHFFWKACIVKSQDMKKSVKISNIVVLPNGVNIKKFYPVNKMEARQKLGWSLEDRIVLFAADVSRPEKNFKLCLQAIGILGFTCVLKTLCEVDNEKMVYWYNASDIILLTSLHEGSPNVIKEAMACNRPIVATNVGDIEWLIGNISGCYIISFAPQDVAEKIKLAIEFGKNKGSTKGRERIIELGLDSETVAKKIIEVYKTVLV
ncbi:MAG: glycosyltransferase family 4 protein [Bacteroidales bacterium]|jgi:glycosyltransferase involved in cell wall biosynthesis